MKAASNIVLKLLGMLLLTAAVLKGWQLLTEPVANSNIWSYRPFLILTVEFELALAIWLLSGLFKKAAWLAGLLCFSAFSVITLYKAITGADSCGCFGSVHVNPWITLFAIDLPAVMTLSIFRPGLSLPPALSFLRNLSLHESGEQESIKNLVKEFLTPMPSAPRFAMTAFLTIATLGISAPILALNEPPQITSSYEVLEPKTWVGKELPILEHIDIAESLRKGTWLVLLYHYDCTDCAWAIPMYEQMARDLAGNEDFLRIALIAVPPYGRGSVSENCPCTLGQLAETKEWFVTTPAVALLSAGKVTSAWEEKAPDLDTIIQKIAKKWKINEKSRFFSSTNHLTHSP
jgi:thiol-disulfide isomerase/thioredoxin